MSQTTHNVFPCLWFDGRAREAADFYCSLFPDAKVTLDAGMVVYWEMNGQKVMGLNGGPHFTFNESVSFFISCDNQEQIDYYWNALTTDGGQEGRCGWCKDKFGFSWQVVPRQLPELMQDPQKRMRVQQAFMLMNKMVIADLEKA